MLKNLFSSFREKLIDYFRVRYEIIRLETISRVVSVLSYVLFVLISAFIFFVALFFVGFGLAEWLSTLFDSRTAGYFCTAGILLLLGIVALLFSKKIIKFFSNKLVKLITQKDGEEK